MRVTHLFATMLVGLFSVQSASARNISRSALDSSRFDGPVKVIIFQRDGKLIVGGKFLNYNKIPSRCIVRLNPDGSLDQTFVVGSGFDKQVSTLVLQPDGKLIAAGEFSTYGGPANSSNRIIRLNSDGSIDKSFVINSGFQGEVFAIALQADGKVVVGGMLAKFNGISCGGLVRLNSNGSLDQSFVFINGISGYVYSLCLLPGGKIMAGGYFGHYNKTVAYGIVRLNNDGTHDNSFAVNKGFGTGSVWALAALPNGKIIAGGDFTSYQGTPCHNLVRLNSDGSFDITFKQAGKPTKEYSGYAVFTLSLQQDGKIIAAGKFDYYGSVLKQSIVKLNADGSIDDSFGGQTGFDTNGHGGATVSSVAITSEGNIVAAGYYKRYDSQIRNNITKLDKNGKLIPDVFQAATEPNKTTDNLAMHNPINDIQEGQFSK